MIIRNLDIDSDWTFGMGRENYLSGNLAVALNVKTRLLSFLNNCFFDMGAGIDWFTYLGVPNKFQEMKLRVRAIILQSYGVVNVRDVSFSSNSLTRQSILTYSMDTIFTTQFTQNIEVVQYA